MAMTTNFILNQCNPNRMLRGGENIRVSERELLLWEYHCVRECRGVTKMSFMSHIIDKEAYCHILDK